MLNLRNPLFCARWRRSAVVARCALLSSLLLAIACADEPAQSDATGQDTAAADAGADTAQSGSDAASSAKTRRVLLLIADDLGVDQVLAYGDKNGDGKADDGRDYPPAPNLNAICTGGMRFDFAWSAPTCSPTRATILTGRYGFRTGVGWAVAKKNQLSLDETTLPELLSVKKVATANIGKWHLGANADIGGEHAPNKAGWSHYAGVLDGTLQDYSNWPRTVNGQTADSTTYATTANVDDAIAWVKGRGTDEPWLLWMAFNAPHSPFHKPPNELHDSDHLSGVAGHRKKNPGLYHRAMVQALDTEVGRLITWLKDNNQAPTDIVFIGDNGSPGQVVTSPWDGKKAKGSLYEGGVRVPCCVAGQGVGKAGVSTALVHTVDLYATIANMFGAAVGSTGEDSKDLAPLLADPTAAWRDFNYTESFGNPQGTPDEQGVAITDGTYKLIRFETGTELFFDLASDRHETKDLKAAGLGGGAKTAYDSLAKRLDGMK